MNTKQETGNFYHTVFFWLKNPDNEEENLFFKTSLKKFIQHSKYIQTKHIGTPASTNRTVIDCSYTYNLVLSFRNKEDQDKYQVEEVHKQFIEECKDLWEKVVVYDSENIL